MKQYLGKYGVRALCGVAVTMLGLWLLLSNASWIRTAVNRLDYLAYDLRLNLTLPELDTNRLNVIIIDIDEASLREEGRWPWSRQKISRLVDALHRNGARTIGFDIAFAEPERNVALELTRAAAPQLKSRPEETRFLTELIPSMDRDRIFASTLEEKNVILGVLFHAVEEKSTGLLPEPWVVLQPNQIDSISIPRMMSYTGNLNVLQAAARDGGYLNTTPDDDGALRSSPLILRYEDGVYPSLALAMARIHKNALRFKLDTVRSGDSLVVTGLWMNRFHIPTDEYGRVLVPYVGKRRTFKYISAKDVLRATGTDAFPELRNAAVIIGPSALGLSDLLSTPLQPAFPGVEVQASILQALVSEDRFRRRPDWAKAANAALVAVPGVVLSLVGPVLGAMGLSLIGLGLVTLLIAGNTWLWTSAYLSISPVLPLLTIVAIISLNMIWGFFREARQKQQVRHAFSHYLAPALVDQLVENPDKLRLTGETRELTFLFSDIAGFTTFTEKTDPEILVSILNEYLEGMCNLVMSHGGTIDKIVGDAVVAIFNAPIDQPDHPARAVNCALAMDKFSREFIDRKRAEGLEFGITRIGLNTGQAVVGNFGGSSRFDYTAHGDPINTAARMESVNKHLGTKICVSGFTVAHCPDHFFRPIGSLVLKGKTEAIDAFEPITEEESRSRRTIAYVEAYECLKRGDPKAADLFLKLKGEYPDDPLVILHTNRIIAGKTSATIILEEK